MWGPQQSESRAGPGAGSCPGRFLAPLSRGQSYARTNICRGRGVLSPDLLTTPVVRVSLAAACYLSNSTREKEGSPVLGDHAHFLACSPTVCPGHLEIQNHDCLKRGKWRPCSTSSPSGPLEEMLPAQGEITLPWEPEDGCYLGPAS